MATTVKSIVSAGGADYTSITNWEAGGTSGRNSDADIWKGEIDDNTNYDETVTFDTAGTPSSTSYIWLTGGTSNRHSGVSGTGHPRNVESGTPSFVFTVQDDWARFEWLELGRDTSDNSHRYFWMNGVANVLIDYCIIWTSDTTPGTQSTAVYANNVAADFTLANSVVYGWGAAGVLLNNYSGSNSQVANIEHCIIGDNGNNGTDNLAGSITTFCGSTASATINLKNTSVVDGGSASELNADNSAGTHTLTGSHNAYTSSSEITANWDTNSTTNWQTATNGLVDSAPASAGVYVTDVTGITTYDFTPVDHANNVLLTNGTNLQGSEADSRSDYSVDITGGSRPTSNVDIGPFQISVSTQTVAITAATESDSAQSFTVSTTRTLAITAATETDSAQALTVSAGAVTTAITAATETDSAQAVTAVPGVRTLAIGAATETDAAQALTVVPGAATVAVTAATETDSAQALTVSAGAVTTAITAATESDSAQAVTSLLTTTIGAATETDAAQAVSVSSTLTQAITAATETDAAQSVTVQSVLAQPITAATETDSAQVFSIGHQDIAQSGYRWYTDDADPTTATALAAEDTVIASRALTAGTQLRIQLDATNDPAGNAYKLQWNYDGDDDALWEDIA